VRKINEGLDARTGSKISSTVGLSILKHLLKQLMIILESLNLEDSQLYSIKKIVVSNLNNTYNNIKLCISDMILPSERDEYFKLLRELEQINKGSFTRD